VTGIAGSCVAERLVVVTGGASGIGAACVRRFVRAGADVVIADRNAEAGEALVAELGGAARFVLLDVGSENAITAFAADLPGAPVALVNCAGVLQGAVRTEAMDIAAWDTIMSVNLRGVLLVSRAVGARMQDAGRGSIVTIASIASFRPGPQPAYATAKAGLTMLTEIMAAEYGPKGVRVNAVAPGYTMTPMMAAMIERGERDPALAIARSALRRFVEPDEVAEGVYFLSSPAASAITGTTLAIECGWLVGSAYAAFATAPD
jgi:NAD(P)-dependent dehydrogenase (short-subunit alcohol dehydrogenase family)